MKKVGLMISQLSNGGAEGVVNRLTHILSENYEVYLILFEDTFIDYEYAGTLVNLDIKSTHKRLNKIFLLIKRIKALRIVKNKYNLDIVISFLESPNIVNVLSKTTECKVGVSIRNYTAYERYRTIFSVVINLCIKTLYRRADVLIPVSKVIADSYVNDYGINKDKLKVIYNPYNIEQIQILANEKLNIEDENFIKNGKTFISMGRMTYQKGYWHLVKAFKLVHDKYNEARLIIIGTDYNNGKVKKIVEDLCIRSSVLLPGQQENPFRLIKNSDAYVLSSLFEGFPNAMVEAMACGCPVIAADCKSGPREILCEDADLDENCNSIEKVDFGILTPEMEMKENWDSSVVTESEKKLADAMMMIIEDEKLRLHYKNKALERAMFFSYGRCKQEWIEIIDSEINDEVKK